MVKNGSKEVVFVQFVKPNSLWKAKLHNDHLQKDFNQKDSIKQKYLIKKLQSKKERFNQTRFISIKKMFQERIKNKN